MKYAIVEGKDLRQLRVVRPNFKLAVEEAKLLACTTGRKERVYKIKSARKIQECRVIGL